MPTKKWGGKILLKGMPTILDGEGISLLNLTITFSCCFTLTFELEFKPPTFLPFLEISKHNSSLSYNLRIFDLSYLVFFVTRAGNFSTKVTETTHIALSELIRNSEFLAPRSTSNSFPCHESLLPLVDSNHLKKDGIQKFFGVSSPN